MAGIFAYTELWLGLGALLAIILLPKLLDNTRAKRSKRIAKITAANTGKLSAATAESLRKRNPYAGSKIGQFIAPFSSIEKLRSRLEIASINTTPQKFLSVIAILCIATFGICILLGLTPLLAVLLSIIVGFGIPHFKLSYTIKKRQKNFLKLFPEGIDLIVRGLRAGLPVSESFNVVSREIPDPVSSIFASISQQTAVGMPMEQALAITAQKLDMTEFNFFVTTIILQRETGGNLSEVLSNLAEVLRDRQMMKLKITALSSEARASAYIVGALPFFVFGILNVISPDYLDPLYNDARGNMAIGIAAGMMGFGAFIMRRMTQFEI